MDRDLVPLFVLSRSESAPKSGDHGSSGSQSQSHSHDYVRMLGDKLGGSMFRKASAEDAESQNGVVGDAYVRDGAVGRHTTIAVELETIDGSPKAEKEPGHAFVD
ncbi:MAG: hypothetical protein M1828_004404 [Chrysothrix sp. TS-e1954]|nr:MAG: hypothetical protein M1828_004404 [Chrysothrix sp. TS-e1954]